MIKTIAEAYQALHGKPPDAETAGRLARIMAAVGATRERDPLAGLLVLLEAYYKGIRCDGESARQARAEAQESLTAVRDALAALDASRQDQHSRDAALEAGLKSILQQVRDGNDSLMDVLDRLLAVQNSLSALRGSVLALQEYSRVQDARQASRDVELQAEVDRLKQELETLKQKRKFSILHWFSDK